MKLISDAYLELVLRVILGQSPHAARREGAQLGVDAAAACLKSLQGVSPSELTASEPFKAALQLSPELLAYAWSRLMPDALTMSGEATLRHLLVCLDCIEEEAIPGDWFEAGSWRGGVALLMRAFLQARGNRSRRVWLADSFQGLPDGGRDLRDQTAHLLTAPLQHLAVSRAEVEEAFRFFGLLDEQVRILPGWFSEALPQSDTGALSLLRLDGDYYESTQIALETLYPRVSVGGFVIVDDYHLPLGCQAAVDEYRRAQGIRTPLEEINGQAVLWRKEM